MWSSSAGTTLPRPFPRSTDTEGNTYTIAAPLVTGTGLSQAIYFAKNIAGEASNPNEVTVTFSGAAPAPDVRVLEYKGLDITNPLDTTRRRLRYLKPGRQRRLHHHHRDGTGRCRSHGSRAALPRPGTGFTTVALTHPNGDNAEHQIRTTVGSCQATAVVASGNWVMQTVAFKVACAGLHHQRDESRAPLRGSGSTPLLPRLPLLRPTVSLASVALSCTVTPVVTSPPTCAFATTPIPGGSGTSALTVNTTATTTPGGYTVTVNGVGRRDPHQGPQPDGYRRCGPGFHHRLAHRSLRLQWRREHRRLRRSRLPESTGFTEAVALTCSVTPAATRGPTCALNPASLTGATLTSTLTVSTTAATTASLEPRSRGLIYAMLLPIGGLALLGTGITSRKKKLWGFLLGCILFSTLIILPACGGAILRAEAAAVVAIRARRPEFTPSPLRVRQDR